MGLIEDNARAEIEELVIKLNKGMPANWARPEREPRRVPTPNYVLLVDGLAPFALVVVIRTGEDGVTRGVVGVPQHDDLPEFHEGPFPVAKALLEANRWAHRYGFEEVIVDIESSQLWDKSWGDLEMPTEDDQSADMS
ncbi:hypothetical protein [Devosia riboflavina]